MSSITTALTLEEMVGIARQVKDWDKVRPYLMYTTSYDGYFKPRGTSKQVKIEAKKMTYSETNPTYEVKIHYKEKEIANLSGSDARKLFEVADAGYAKIQQERLELANKKGQKKLTETQRVIQELKGRLAPKPERLPFWRRIGK